MLLSKSVSERIIFSGYSSYVLHGDGEMHLVRKRMKSTLQSDHFFIFSCPTCVVVVVSGFRCKCFPPSKYMRRFIRHKRDLKHRQRNKRRRCFETEADWAKGFVFGGENQVSAVQLPTQTTTFSLRRTLSCNSLVIAFKAVVIILYRYTRG